ncbi:MAG: hypothetical protein M1818_003114 [Claussenomyces sp. TS43310]|nr:MAG: hypothetical protein M1818_003114 [Claussenomyces sp. TS43310]
MIVSISALAFAATLLSSPSLILALSPTDIPSDTPISSLISSANAHLAKGETNDALTYYDVAISRDPNNYLTFFKRATTYLSLGRTVQAQDDFDKVLQIKPGFEGALLQRAKIKSRIGDWEAAKADYEAAGKTGGGELSDLLEAQGAAALALDAEKKGDWEECVTQSGVAIMIASKMLSLRQIRSRCRFARGEVQEGISDLMHVLQMQPGLTEPHLRISSILFYAMADVERGTAQIRKCLHSDPDSKSCKKLHKQEKATEKALTKINKFLEKKQYNGVIKLLVKSSESAGLIQEVKDEVKELQEAGTIPAIAPKELITRLVEMACEAYTETNSKKATAYCDEVLTLNEHSKYGLLSKAQREMDHENFEACIQTLNTVNEHHPGDHKVQDLLQKAQIALKRSKEKDYYKILGIPHDADERQIKAGYRKMTKIHHPDKAVRQGYTKEDAEKKMAGINEAYEVLSDPELKARFDRGDDPNSHEQQRQPFQGSPFGGGRGFQFQQHHSGGQSGGQHFQFQFPGGFPGFG